MDISLEAALAAAAAGVEAAKARSISIGIVILDQRFVVLVAVRMDRAFPSTVPVATGKAHTALNFGVSSSAIAAKVVAENKVALTLAEPRLLFVGGGEPVICDGVVVGAVGVSGASEEMDCEISAIVARMLSNL